VGVAGDSAATSGSAGSAAPAAPGGSSSGTSTSGSDGLGSGTQVVAPITAPVNTGSIAAGVLGDSSVTNPGSAGGTAPFRHGGWKHHQRFGWDWFRYAGCCSDYGSGEHGFHCRWCAG
jgi:hypothetical protein